VLVAGVDGTKDGWVGVVLRDRRFERAEVMQPIETEFVQLGDVEVIAIDVPIGFGPRAADVEARRFLKGAASTVFSTPTRAVLETPFRAGLGVSAQAHALGPRVIHMSDMAAKDRRLREVHPEVSFQAMNGGEPLGLGKRSAGGALRRIALLEEQGIALGDLGQAARAPLDDVLDAAAAAWSAHRIALGRHGSLPEPPEINDGLSVAILY
jgi:predicted RNase H-like nuclease